MARIISEDSSVVWQWGRFVVLGILMGILYFLLVQMLEKYVVGPISCGGGSAVNCAQSYSVSGGIASILVAVGALFASIKLFVPRPLLVVVAATVLTFGLYGWVQGLFWLEALGWSALIYAVAFSLFCAIFQFRNVIVSIIVTVAILVAERIVLAL